MIADTANRQQYQMSLIWRLFGILCIGLSPFEIFGLWDKTFVGRVEVVILGLLMLVAGLEILSSRLVLGDSMVVVRSLLKGRIAFSYGDIADIRVKEGRGITVVLKGSGTEAGTKRKCTIHASVISPQTLCRTLQEGMARERNFVSKTAPDIDSAGGPGPDDRSKPR